MRPQSSKLSDRTSSVNVAPIRSVSLVKLAVEATRSLLVLFPLVYPLLSAAIGQLRDLLDSKYSFFAFGRRLLARPGGSPLFAFHEPYALLIDQQRDAAAHAARRMPGAGRVDDEAARWVGARFIELVALEDEHVLIAEVLVQRDARARLITEQHGGRPAMSFIIQPMGGHARTERLPIAILAQRIGLLQEI